MPLSPPASSGGGLATAATVTVTAPTVTTTQVLAAANPLRLGMTVSANSTNLLYVTLGPTSTAASATFILCGSASAASNCVIPSNYLGAVSANATGGGVVLQVTVLTA